MMDQYTTDITELVYRQASLLIPYEHLTELRTWCNKNFGIGKFSIKWTETGVPRQILVVYKPEHMILFKLRWGV